MAEREASKRVALVTGASGGIGLELARLLAADGHDLVLAARRGDRLQAICGELTVAHGIHATAVQVDLAHPAGADALVRAVSDRGVAPDVVVNDAGVGLHGPFDAADPAALTALLQLDVMAVAQLTRAFLPAMRARRQGRILNVASTAAFAPGPFMAAYYASKAFVLSLSVALAEELAGSGVTVTALCPGATRTGFDEAAGVSRARLFRANVMEAAPVARAGYAGMMAGKAVVVPGLLNKVLASTSGLAPRRLTAKVARALHDPEDMS